ncbi:MAG: hypothetical protein IT236_18180 [Bacteroidia bacterium]|nr:hypothetical protein [Bacteroidia bacterium]
MPFFLNAGNSVVEPLSLVKTSRYPSNPMYSGGEEGFTAVYDGKRVILSWHASSKKSFDVYTVEKSKDGLHYFTTLIVKGAGHSAAEAGFTDIDYSPYTGVSYYRLKQCDYQGNITYSPVMPVNFKYTKDGSLVAANQQLPDESELLKIENKEVLVLVRDPKGNEFTTKVKVNKESDNKLYAVESGHSLGKGTYLVMAASSNALNSQKLIVR